MRIIASKSIMVFSIIILNCCLQNGSEVNPVELRCEYGLNPLGVETTAPRLTWILESEKRDQQQTAYQVIVASSVENLKLDKGDIWNSGRVDSDQSIHVSYDGEQLRSGMRYFWKVRIWDKDGRISDWSETAFWEMGLLDNEAWKADWISHDCKSAPMIRYEFNVDKSIKDARVYISGIGYHELRINGSKIGDHVLDPGQTDYEQRVFYVIHDVTDAVNLGPNAIGVILGNGFYHQTVVNEARFGWGDVDYGKPRLIFQMRITYTDGTEAWIISDEKWKGSSGPILFNNIYAGEIYDARLEQTGWDMPRFDDSDWENVHIVEGPGGKLISQKLPPIKKMLTLKPVNILNPKPGIYVYDLGQNIAGWAKLKNINEEPGTTIQLRYAESIHENGMIDPASTGVYATNVIQTDKYICKGSNSETWEPRFTYHGFRYVEMSGLSGEPVFDNLEGVVVYTAVDTAGKFECSDEMLNRIHETAIWSQIGNMHSLPTDCPHREKCGWLGDAFLCAEMSIYNLDVPLFWSKYIRDIKTSSEDGVPDNIAPGRRRGGFRPDWASAYIILPWHMYLYYGDTSIVSEHWEDMTLLMEHFISLSKGFIIYEGYGDLFEPGSVYPKRTPVELTSTALFYFNAKIMSVLSRKMDKHEQSQKYIHLANNIKSAFNKEFYNEKDKTYGSQTANCLALYFGLAPESDAFSVAATLALDITDQFNGHHSSGIFGYRYLYLILSKYGYGDLAHQMLNLTTYPSIGDLFNRGATTFWEYWGEREIDETSAGTRSRNHIFQGAFDAWFFNGVGGINPDPELPGFKHIILKPQLIGDLTFAKAKYNSMHGIIKSQWQVHQDKITWFVIIPANTTATVYIPTCNKESIRERDLKPICSKGITFKEISNGSVVYKIGSGDYFFSWDK